MARAGDRSTCDIPLRIEAYRKAGRVRVAGRALEIRVRHLRARTIDPAHPGRKPENGYRGAPEPEARKSERHGADAVDLLARGTISSVSVSLPDRRASICAVEQPMYPEGRSSQSGCHSRKSLNLLTSAEPENSKRTLPACAVR